MSGPKRGTGRFPRSSGGGQADEAHVRGLAASHRHTGSFGRVVSQRLHRSSGRSDRAGVTALCARNSVRRNHPGRSYFEVINRLDFEGIGAIFADAAVQEWPGSGEVIHGRAAILAEVLHRESSAASGQADHEHEFVPPADSAIQRITQSFCHCVCCWLVLDGLSRSSLPTRGWGPLCCISECLHRYPRAAQWGLCHSLLGNAEDHASKPIRGLPVCRRPGSSQPWAL
jgi:hypothetical protein